MSQNKKLDWNRIAILGGCARGVMFILLMFGTLVDSSAVWGQDRSSANDRPVAWVDNDQILESEVDAHVEEALRGRSVEGRALDLLRAQAVKQLVSRRLVLNHLRGAGLAASDADLRLEVERIKEQLARTDRSLEDYLESRGVEESQLMQSLTWRLSWANYLDKFLTAENLEKYFEEHRREFDGTQLRAAQIFIRAEGREDDEVDKAIQKMDDIRQGIVSGDDEFEDVAREVSESPTSEQGGDLGWVGRDGSLPESVLEALFKLDQGDISPPVVSSYGIHLVRWTESKAGEKEWQDAGPGLRLGAMTFLFNWVADQQREKSEVGYADSYPHFDPETGELSGTDD